MSRKRTLAEEAAVRGRVISRRIEKQATLTSRKLTRIAERAIEEVGEATFEVASAAARSVKKTARATANALPGMRRKAKSDSIVAPFGETVSTELDDDQTAILRAVCNPPHLGIGLGPRAGATQLEEIGTTAGGLRAEAKVTP
jgi:hypothetical protein